MKAVEAGSSSEAVADSSPSTPVVQEPDSSEGEESDTTTDLADDDSILNSTQETLNSADNFDDVE